MVPKGQEKPKAADFIQWAEVIADTITAGSSHKEIRRHLKTIAGSTWQFVSWLTHAANAVRYDGEMAVNATYAVLNAFGAALLRHEATNHRPLHALRFTARADHLSARLRFR